MSNQTLVKQLKKQVAEMQEKISSLSETEKKANRPGKSAALPFKGFDRLASSDRKGSLRIIRAQSPEALRAGIAFEKQGLSRKQVLGWMEETLSRLEAGLPAKPKRGRPSGKPATKKPRKATGRTRARRGRPPKAQARRRGRPSLSERPLKMKGRPPVKDYPSWSLTSADPKGNMRRRILALDDPKQIKALISFESRQDHPRSTTLRLLERRYRAVSGTGMGGGKVKHDPAKLPFAGYEKVASSRQKSSRAILNKQSLSTLEKTLAYERSYIGRAQVEDMLQDTIRQKRIAELPQPMPGWEKVASSNLTYTRRLLRSASPAQLRGAMEYELATRNRVQVLREIEDAMTRKAVKKPSKPRAKKPAQKPAKKPAALPFKGFDRLASSDRKGSLRIIRAQSPEALRAGIAFEKQGLSRKQVLGWMEETLSRLEAGLPAKPKRGRPSGKPATKKPRKAKAPVEDYDDLPQGLLISTIRRGFFDDRLDKILAYETAGRARRGVISAVKSQISGAQPKFKGREPWPGYHEVRLGSPEEISRSFSGRSEEELRLVRSAEGRQDSSSAAAVAAAEALLLTPA